MSSSTERPAGQRTLSRARVCITGFGFLLIGALVTGLASRKYHTVPADHHTSVWVGVVLGALALVVFAVLAVLRLRASAFGLNTRRIRVATIVAALIGVAVFLVLSASGNVVAYTLLGAVYYTFAIGLLIGIGLFVLWFASFRMRA